MVTCLWILGGIVLWYAIAFYGVRHAQHYPEHIYDGAGFPGPDEPDRALLIWLVSPIPPVCVFLLLCAFMGVASFLVQGPLTPLARFGKWMFRG